MVNDAEPVSASGGAGDGGADSSVSSGGSRVKERFRRPGGGGTSGAGGGPGGGAASGAGDSPSRSLLGGGPSTDAGGNTAVSPVHQSAVGGGGANGGGDTITSGGASGASGTDNRAGRAGDSSDSSADSSAESKPTGRARRNTLAAAGVVRLPEIDEPTGLPEPVPIGPKSRGGARSKGSPAGRQEAPTGTASPGSAPDIDGLVLYLLLSGRDALAVSRGSHWQQGITEEALGPVAGNLAEALRRAFPELARSAESKSPLIAGIMGLGLLIAPIIAYERMVLNVRSPEQEAGQQTGTV